MEYMLMEHQEEHGHSKEILKKLSKDGILIGIDRDQDALKAAKNNLKNYTNVKYIHSNHDEIKKILEELKVDGVNGILLDFGVSSYQLDEKKSSGEIDDSTYNLNLSKFENNLNSIHTSLYSDENKTLSYTIRTNVLRDYARNNYGIRLSRQSNVSLSVTISSIKNSIVDSVLL